ncbi:hypothetical protein KIL84_022468, partial [Mauremys mutica]
ENLLFIRKICSEAKDLTTPLGRERTLGRKLRLYCTVKEAVTTTNDGGTIFKLLEVEHLAPTWLCELAELQDKESGDGTISDSTGMRKMLVPGSEEQERGSIPNNTE